MNKFEFMRNLEMYRAKKPSDVLQHDSYEIPEREDHSIKSDYFKAPKAYKDKITLYEEYNDSLKHAGTYKPAGTHEYVAKIENAFGPGKHRYFYTKEEWDNYNKNKQFAEQSSNAESEKWNNKRIENNPQWLNSEGKYIEPVKNIYAELNSSHEGRSRIYQTYVTDFSWSLRDRDYDNKEWDKNFEKRKEYAFEEIDKIYNKSDAQKIKNLLNNLEDDQRNVVKYMNDNSDNNYYKEKLQTENMHKVLADAINRKKVDDREFRTEAEAVKYALNKIEDSMYHVWYEFMEKDSKAKDFYKRYEHNVIGKNDELNFRGHLLKRMEKEVKKNIIESFPKEVIKKYFPEEFWK